MTTLRTKATTAFVLLSSAAWLAIETAPHVRW